MNLLIAIAVAIIGGLIGVRLGLPQGALLGGLVAVAALNINGRFPVPRLPGPVLFAMYILIAVELGAGVEKSTLAALGRVWFPAVLFVVLLVAFSIGYAVLIQKLFGLDLATWVFGTAPGAVSGITAMAADVKGNVAVVVALHTLRVTAIVLAVPWLYRLLVK